MGFFLSLSGVINCDAARVETSIRKYTEKLNGGFEKANIGIDHPNIAIIGQNGPNTTLVYPDSFAEWDDASAFLSQELSTAVFSFHIHDEDLWMFQLFVNGEMITRFNPIPDYWVEDVTIEELDSWKGDASLISGHVPGVQAPVIEKYFIRWDWEYDEDEKAYEGDEYGYGDCWQLLDFMKKLGLDYPIDETGKVNGKK